MERYKKGLPDRSFTDLVTFYNAGLDHLATTLKVDFFRIWAWRLKNKKEVITFFILPHFSGCAVAIIY